MQLRIRPKFRLHLLLVLALTTTLIGCASNDEVHTEVDNITDAYELAKLSIKRRNFRRGIQILEAIQARFPFSDLSRLVQLDLMHAYYKSGQREEAVEAADTFIRENPIHARVDYALYIKGLAYYEEGAGFLERWFRKDVSQRPPKDLDRSYATFRRLVDRYPASDYSADAEQRMVAIQHRLAVYENHIADYYLRRGAYIAAVNRATAALEAYNGAPANARSLQIMAAAYDKLGMDKLAADTRRILALNYPNGS